MYRFCWYCLGLDCLFLLNQIHDKTMKVYLLQYTIITWSENNQNFISPFKKSEHVTATYVIQEWSGKLLTVRCGLWAVAVPINA